RTAPSSSERGCPATVLVFFFADPATTELYTLSLHDALPISRGRALAPDSGAAAHAADRRRRRGIARGGAELDSVEPVHRQREGLDRKSTRLNSSHVKISYAVFCLKKKINKEGSRTHGVAVEI